MYTRTLPGGVLHMCISNFTDHAEIIARIVNVRVQQ